MTLKNTNFLNSTNGNCRLNQSKSKDPRISKGKKDDILFPKRPNKRYQQFIKNEKHKYDENWENKLKDQNLTDQNFFLNYYSYEKTQELNFFPSDYSMKINKESKNPIISSPLTKNVHSPLSKSLPAQNFRINQKTFTVITGKKKDTMPLYQIGTPSSTKNDIQTELEDDNEQGDKDIISNKSIELTSSEKIDNEFEYLNSSIKSKTLQFSTPIKKINQSNFSKTSKLLTPQKKMTPTLPLYSNENTNSLSHFLNIDNTTQFAPLPKRQAKTSQGERKAKSSQQKIIESNQLGVALPEMRIPTREEIAKLKILNQKAITSQSLQNEKFPTINNASRSPCSVLSNAITAFDLY